MVSESLESWQHASVCYFQPLVVFQASNVSLSRKSLIMSPELTTWLSEWAVTMAPWPNNCLLDEW